MAPVLFNIYFNAMVGMWRGQSGEAGVPILYQYGRKLVGDTTAKSRLLKVHVTESDLADDLAMYTVIREALVLASKRCVRLASCFGLTVSLPKTKGLAMGSAFSEDDVSLYRLMAVRLKWCKSLLIWAPNCLMIVRLHLKLAVVLLGLLKPLAV